MRRPFATVAAPVVTLLFGITTMLSPQVSMADEIESASDQTLRVLQFNVCGNVCYGGNLDAGQDVADSIISWGARLVTLNEVCQTQLDNFTYRTGLNNLYFETSGPRSKDGRGQSNCAFDYYGIASMTDNGYVQGSRRYRYLDNPSSNEWRGVDCMNTPYLHTVALCVTHIDNNWIYSQTYNVRQHVAPVVTTYSFGTLLGGDFNSTPSEDVLDYIYSSRLGQGGYGQFGELDETDAGAPARSGDATQSGGKIDYLFFSDNSAWRSPYAIVSGAGVSDHDILKGTIVLKTYK